MKGQSQKKKKKKIYEYDPIDEEDQKMLETWDNDTVKIGYSTKYDMFLIRNTSDAQYMINFDSAASDMPCTNPGFQPERETPAYPLLEVAPEGGCDDYEHDHDHSEIIDVSTEREFYDENP